MQSTYRGDKANIIIFVAYVGVYFLFLHSLQFLKNYVFIAIFSAYLGFYCIFISNIMEYCDIF